MTTWVRVIFLLLAVVGRAADARAGAPLTANGPDVIVGDATGAAGETVTVDVRYVPAADDAAAGGPDEIAVLQFSLGFTGFQYEAAGFNPDGNAVLAASFIATVDAPVDPADPSELLVVISDVSRQAVLPEATLLRLTFRIPQQSPLGQMPLTVDAVGLRDRANVLQPLDEAIDGVITVTEPLPPSPTATPTRPTPTPTASPTRVPTTPRFTPTRNPPTPGPGTPPPGLAVTVISNDGGCAIGDPHGSLVGLLAMMLLLYRRWRSR
jgi:hypothetical protein